MIFSKKIVITRKYTATCYRCQSSADARTYRSAFWIGITHMCPVTNRETNYGV